MNDDITRDEIRQDANERISDLTMMLREVRDHGLIYWEPNTSRGHDRKADMLARIARLIGPT